jgi:hypothetical protein
MHSSQAVCAGLLVIAACSARTDLGLACRMTRPCDAGQPCGIQPSELDDPRLDYLSFDSPDCEVVCLRTAGSDNPELAMGYCSGACRDDTGCSPDGEGRTGSLRCMQLLLSGPASRYCIEPRAPVAW